MKVDGEKVREYRKDRGYNLSEFAKEAGLSVSYMSEIEHGTTNPSLKTIRKIANVLNVEKNLLMQVQEMDLGNKIRMLRNEKDISLCKVAENTGISSSYLSEIERGNVRPSVSTVKRLAEFLEVSPSILIGESITLGEKLKKLRKEQGITQAELAENAGVSAGLIGQIEHQKVQPSLQTVEKVAKVLGVSPCFFILEDNAEGTDYMLSQMNPELRNLLSDENVQSVLRLVCNCTEKELKFILDFIKLYKRTGSKVVEELD